MNRLSCDNESKDAAKAIKTARLTGRRRTRQPRGGSPRLPNLNDEQQITEATKPSRKTTWLRLGLLFLFLLGTYALAKWGGYLDDINIRRIQRAVEDAGAWGVLLFAGLFVLGVLLHLPGMLFVGTGIIVFGRLSGYFISLGSATLAVCISFLIARTIGGKALGEVKASFVRRLLKRIDDHPVRVMIVFRLIFFLSPPLNFAIALTRIRFRDYAIGSAVGLIIPMFVVTVLFDWLLATEWVRQWLFN